ncbi:toxin-antitoxin system YwqK family antitoxin [Salinisphaera hydrothermalis]|uniref:MORN repeat-containing protein n=1 Tax=Salinisphaera hydrothermalis (strain C41B8) TaxID=1304275 RepID=A0A084IKU6_SALHC|nr:hypothetical protein [Salinisphaera hydrothermalis]KEZ77330.1 hypothetical protein C41B8_10730 [Salinisphaera hydrothermalis C41B8]
MKRVVSHGCILLGLLIAAQSQAQDGTSDQATGQPESQTAASPAAAQSDSVYWLNKDYGIVPRSQAAYKATVGKQDGDSWPIAIDDIDDGGKIYRGHINAADYAADDTHFVGEYTTYRDDDHSRQESGQYDAAGKFDGLITTYRRDGAVRTKTEYAHGKRDGWSRFFDRKGRLDTETHYVDGQREGLKKTYVQGHLYWRKHYHNDALEGVAEKYVHYGDKTERIAQTHYHEGRPDGWFRFYSGGQLEHEIHYSAGKTDGTARYFYRNSDQLRRIEHYKDGKRVGTSHSYSRSGKPSETIVYADDGSEEIIERKRFNSRTGHLLRHVYRTGEGNDRRLVRASFDRHGYLESRSTLYLETKRRRRIKFADDGRLTYLEEKRDGKRVGAYVAPVGRGHVEHGRYGPDGQQQGKATRIDRYGNRVAVMHYVDGQLNGEYTGYTPDGEINEHGTYRNGKRVGHWTVASPRSDLIWQGRYDNAWRVGHWEARDSTGQLRVAGNYNDKGGKDGIWVFYDDKGQLKDCPRYTHGKRGDTPDFHAADTPSAADYCRDRLPEWAKPEV